jgi:NAD+ diphosphatase
LTCKIDEIKLITMSITLYILAIICAWNSFSDSMNIFYSDSKFARRTVSQKCFDEILGNSLTHFVPVSKGENFYFEETKRPISLHNTDLQDAEALGGNKLLYVYLGSKAGIEYVAVDLPSGDSNQAAESATSTVPTLPLRLRQLGVKADILRSFSEQLADFDDASLLAHARGMIVWHNSTRYCCKCGSKTNAQRAGASRKCSNDACKSSSYPRLEPASIMLITDRASSHCLLGRKAAWPVGRYSALAGFTEVGETLEQTVVRETFEEAGVVVEAGSLRMVASQPWPFPSSLMIGYRGVCQDQGLPNIHFDEKEMQDVRWFSKDDVRNSLEGGSTSLGDWKPNEKESVLHFPGVSSLARVLLTQWCDEV